MQPLMQVWRARQHAAINTASAMASATKVKPACDLRLFNLGPGMPKVREPNNASVASQQPKIIACDRLERCAYSCNYATAGQRQHFFQEGKMVARFFIEQIYAAQINVVVSRPDAKFVTNVCIQEGVAGRRRFEWCDAILAIDALTFDASAPMFTLVIY